MYVDEAIERIIGKLNLVMIQASESEKMTEIKSDLNKTASAVRESRRQAMEATQNAKEEKPNAD